MDEFIQLNCLTTLSVGKWLKLVVLKFPKEIFILIVVWVKYPQIEIQQLRSAISCLIS